FVRFMAGSKNRKAWSKLFFDVDFNTPLKELESLEYFIPLQMVRLAPSAANKQPWRIIKSSNSYDFYLEQSKDSKNDSYNDMHKIDIGIAMCHFELTSAELGLEGYWEKLKLSSQDNKKYIISWVRK
ncbi:nitroreductase family protein, partial [Clostridium beijerinckii]